MIRQHWKPSAARRQLAARAALIEQVRAFFSARQVLEVETPLLCSGTVTDPAIAPMRCGERWLQTSPEYAMKRLLAAGSGPIYQLCKAFREDEVGGRHNPEFTLLEWYRPGFTLEALMGEVAELVAAVLGRSDWSAVPYASLFERHLDLDPHTADGAELEACVRARLDYSGAAESRETWLDLLLSHVIEPELEGSGVLFIHDFPASQASLAQVTERHGVPVAERFELYVDGMELANGYRELTDPAEQRRRFEVDNAVIAARGETPRPLDERMLSALEAGLPDCAGVALGVDRLTMLKTGAEKMEQVLAFGWSQS